MRILKLTLANFFLLCALYSFGVLGYHTLKHNEYSLSWLVIGIVMCIAILFGIVLTCLSYKKHRVGRFNIDIFTTIYLFLVFMLGFIVPSGLNFQFTHTGGFFGFLAPIVFRLGENSIGIYEIFFFIAMILYGLTIGEHKQKYYA